MNIFRTPSVVFTARFMLIASLIVLITGLFVDLSINVNSELIPFETFFDEVQHICNITATGVVDWFDFNSKQINDILYSVTMTAIITVTVSITFGILAFLSPVIVLIYFVITPYLFAQTVLLTSLIIIVLSRIYYRPRLRILANGVGLSHNKEYFYKPIAKPFDKDAHNCRGVELFINRHKCYLFIRHNEKLFIYQRCGADSLDSEAQKVLISNKL